MCVCMCTLITGENTILSSGHSGSGVFYVADDVEGIATLTKLAYLSKI